MFKKNKEELIDFVRKIMECEGSEEEIDNWLLEVKDNVTHPAVSDLIFYPEKNDVIPEEIVEEALSYQPLNLG